VRSPANADRLASFIGLNGARDLGRTKVTRLKLKSSVLSPAGPRYTDLREYALA
jgi:2'-5' RNA ligase